VWRGASPLRAAVAAARPLVSVSGAAPARRCKVFRHPERQGPGGRLPGPWRLRSPVPASVAHIPLFRCRPNRQFSCRRISQPTTSADATDQPGHRRPDEFFPAGTRARVEADPITPLTAPTAKANITLARPDPAKAMVWRQPPTAERTLGPGCRSRIQCLTTPIRERDGTRPGGVAEWSNAPVLKTGISPKLSFHNPLLPLSSHTSSPAAAGGKMRHERHQRPEGRHKTRHRVVGVFRPVGGLLDALKAIRLRRNARKR
jgi:hypothetical protein